jgi:hypothetical protein
MDQMDEIRSIFSPILGERVWGAKLGIGSFLTMEWGWPRRRGVIRGRALPPRGAWHLWIQHCAWRFEQGDKVLTASEDDRETIAALIPRLNGHILLDIQIRPAVWDTFFIFDDALVIRTFTFYTTEYENWDLFMPDDNVLTLGPINQWSYGSSNLPRDKVPTRFYSPPHTEEDDQPKGSDDEAGDAVDPA